MRCGSEEQLHLRCRKAPDHNTLVFGSLKIATVEGSCIRKTHTWDGEYTSRCIEVTKVFHFVLVKKKKLTLKHIKANTSYTYKSYTKYFLIDIKAFFLHTRSWKPLKCKNIRSIIATCQQLAAMANTGLNGAAQLTVKNNTDASPSKTPKHVAVKKKKRSISTNEHVCDLCKWVKKKKKMGGFSASESNSGEAQNVSETKMMARQTPGNYIHTCTM